MARVNMGASLPAINQTGAEGNAPASLNGAAAGGEKKPIGWAALRKLHKQGDLPKRPPTPLEKVLARFKRIFGKISYVVNTLAVQFVLYCVYVLFFQALIAAVRVKEEVYLTKYLLDNIIEEPISMDGDADNHRQFMTIANFEDSDMFIEHVLMPALVVDGRLDGEFKTPAELAETMDNLDWSAGLMIKQARVKRHDASECGMYETAGMLRWFLKNEYGACPHENQLWGEGRQLVKECPLSQPHRYGACYPELSSALVPETDALVDKSDFGFNWTHPDMPPHAPWTFFTEAELGADPTGQSSASTTSSYNTLPNAGYVTVFIPFFSGAELPRTPTRTARHPNCAWQPKRLLTPDPSPDQVCGWSTRWPTRPPESSTFGRTRTTSRAVRPRPSTFACASRGMATRSSSFATPTTRTGVPRGSFSKRWSRLGRR